MLEKNINYSLNNYLFCNDLLQKNLVRSSHKVPFVSRVSLSFILEDFTKNLNMNANEDLVYKSFTFSIYSILGIFPKINLERTCSTTIDGAFVLTVLINNNKDALQFLYSIFILASQGFKKTHKRTVILGYSKISFFLPLDEFFEFYNLSYVNPAKTSTTCIKIDVFFDKNSSRKSCVFDYPMLWLLKK